MREFRDKVAVVTGAGSGIGRALALRFAAEGMRVAAADVDPTGLAGTVDQLEAAAPARSLGQVVDVADGRAMAAFADRTFDAFGRVDVVCNNAGVFVAGTLWDRPDADLEFVLGANLWGVLNGIRAFVPRMLAQGTEGHIVTTSSVAGLFVAPYSGPYALSKFAAFAATEALAHDLAAAGAKLTASVLCPGMIDTAIATSDRLRPDRLVTERSEEQQFTTDYLAGAIAGAMAPERVADVVVDGIRGERFLLLTHAEYGDELRARTEALVDGRLPALATFV